MSDQQKNEEGTLDNQVNVFNSVEPEETKEAGKTLEQEELERSQSNRIKNLVSVVILLLGIVLGSLFVDAAQFFSGSGYSERALKNAEIFEGAGKTWVAFTDPMVQLQVLTVSDEELKKCPKCDATEVVAWLKKFVPTVVAQKVDANSEQGKRLVEQYDLKTIPAFVFDNKIKDAEFYKGEASVLFEEKAGKFVLNSTQLGVPIGKYLETPVISENDPVIGNKDAKVKIVIFSDFQCPYCKMFYNSITKVAKEYGDKVALVYKDFPLEFHPQAQNSAQAGLCANQQGKFWEMADLLYANQDSWGKTQGKEAFKTLAKKVPMDYNEFNSCLDSDKYKEQIEKSMEQGTSFGVTGTPSGFVGQQFIGGVVKEEELKKMIEEELKK